MRRFRRMSDTHELQIPCKKCHNFSKKGQNVNENEALKIM